MKKNKLILLMGILMAFTLNYSIAYGISPAANPSPVPVLIYTLIFIFLIKIVLKYYIPFLVLIGYIAIFTAYPFIYGSGLKKFIDFLSWSYSYMIGKNAVDYSYVNKLCVLMYFIVSLIFYLFTVKWNLFPAFFLSGMIIFTAQWYGFVNKAYVFMLIYVALSLIYLTVLRQTKDTISKSVIGWGAGAAFFVIVVSLILPNNIKPVKVQKINDFISQKFDIVHYARSSDAPLTSRGGSLGFSDGRQLLGGRVIYNNQTALYIKTSLNTVYLRGKTYDSYDGKSWFSSGEKRTVHASDDSLDIYADKAPGDKTTVSLKPGSLVTSDIFNILSPISVTTPGGKYTASYDYNIKYGTKLTNDDAYSVTALVPEIDPNVMRNLQPNSAINSLVNQKYLALPAGLPKRVADLAKSITADSYSDIDKALKIQSYLRSFSYTLNVPSLPYNQDFVDNFLFNQKKGYCSYFASAMAVMLRSVGIPSRYVVGFIYQNDFDKSTAVNGYKRVTNDMSHAWVEAYFPGYGWVTFEPTPFYLPTYMDPSQVLAYGTSSNRMNQINAAAEPSPGSSNIENTNRQTTPNTQASLSAKNKTQAKTISNQDRSGKGDANIFGIGVLIIFIGILTYKMIMYLYIRSMAPRKRSIYQFNKILKKLKKTNHPIKKGETLLEYGNRMSKSLMYDMYFNDIATAYNRIYYGREASPQDVQIISEYLKMISKINLFKW